MHKSFNLRTIGAAVLALAANSVVSAAPLYVSFDNFNYSGTVTRYATAADAAAGSNAISSTTIATATNDTRSTLPNARDGQVYVAAGATGYDPTNIAYYSTAWYFTTFLGNGDGWGNPNNTNTGFVQYYDLSANPVVDGGWSNAYKTFTLSIAGGDGDSSNAARLWAAPSVGGPSGDTGGIFRSFDLSLTADFAVAATLNGTTGWFETGAMPFALLGNANGIFENQSTTDTSLNGFYAFDFTFAQGSWAADEGATWNDGQYSPAAFFAAPAVVPEPGSLALIGLGLVGLVVSRRRTTA